MEKDFQIKKIDAKEEINAIKTQFSEEKITSDSDHDEDELEVL